MSRKEIEELIEKIETQQFLLKMKDYWSGDDFARDREYSHDLKELRAKLKEVEV